VGQKYNAKINYYPHTIHKTLQFFFFVFSGLSPALTCFMDNLEETFLTCGSYSPSYQWNFHNLKVTYQAIIFFQFIYLYFYKKIIVLHMGEGSNLDPSPIHFAWIERLVKSSQKNLLKQKWKIK
jgi:hypothetical protein